MKIKKEGPNILEKIYISKNCGFKKSKKKLFFVVI